MLDRFYLTKWLLENLENALYINRFKVVIAVAISLLNAR